MTIKLSEQIKKCMEECPDDFEILIYEDGNSPYDISHEVVSELEKLEQDAKDLAAYARMQQFRGNFPTKPEQNKLNVVVKNEWRALDTWHQKLSTERMNWLNRKLSTAIDELGLNET